MSMMEHPMFAKGYKSGYGQAKAHALSRIKEALSLAETALRRASSDEEKDVATKRKEALQHVLVLIRETL